MTTSRSADDLVGLVRELCKLPRRPSGSSSRRTTPTRRRSASTSRALERGRARGQGFAYLVWGVRDDDHAIVGTHFDPGAAKVGNEELESWLLRLLEPKLHFRFFPVEVDGQRVVQLEIARAQRQPVRFEGIEFIRVGSYKKKLKDFPEKERALWRVFDQTPFEIGVAREHASGDEVPRCSTIRATSSCLAARCPTIARASSPRSKTTASCARTARGAGTSPILARCSSPSGSTTSARSGARPCGSSSTRARGASRR